VTKTGGLADTVVPYLPRSGNIGLATGFQIKEHTAKAVIAAVRDAVKVFGDVTAWNRLIDNGMRVDVSWAKSAKAYIELFNSLVSVR
jgi:starch synthase